MNGLVCFCHTVDAATIREAIRKGALTVNDLGVKTLAGTGCLSCHDDLEYLIKTHIQPESTHQSDQLHFGF